MAGGFSGLRPWLRPWAQQLVRLAGPYVSITSTRRSRRQQSLLYRRYLRGQSRFPAAPPGRSKHEQGLAFDLYGDRDVLNQLGQIWERWGGRWGGRFNDPIHFEV